ncbi:type II CRISPR RNA-guided endonuclease Cas9 [Roseomonas genomospecies 6]|uniref:CRISPR-associated endonuclease Cas9 n=1 Tax=Roseomonas genomospecies 6 TaxID=214106 RepID=A0A9W7NG72_9PROT|nr:type II CRISPR RNA-guided endonuclease Cas9 [Roseomonas genomospecies 6]KAA0677966.1 type II CRISPR RNA-guided endonuclease Cas9 [Roseomonas genomospecies 6]
MQPYRLSLDLGTNSLGWCVLELDHDGQPKGIRRMGVRIFPDGRNPQDKSSLAVARRIARQMRRRRDRTLVRRDRLMAALIRFGLMPADRAARKALETLDPLALRARGVTERLEANEIGRALFHINQRRGFKAMRGTGDEEEAGKIRTAIDKLEVQMEEAGAPTLGAFFDWLRANGRSVRARMVGRGAKAEYPFYPARPMLEEEFDKLWAAQAYHHPNLLTEEARTTLRHRIFHQRPLKPPAVGKCSLFPDDPRAPRALPSAQRFRLYTELANLRIIAPDRSERPLTIEERDLILRAAKAKPTRKAITFKDIRKVLKLGSDVEFSHESTRRPELATDETSALLSDKKRFGPRWAKLTLAEQDEVVERLLSETDEGALIDWLAARWELEPEAAARVADTPLPDFHLRIGRKALAALLPVLEREAREGRPIRYDEAVPVAIPGAHHSDRRPGEQLYTLPYYGAVLERHVAFGTGDPKHLDEKRLGRLANPTVHIGLNQVRLVINELIERYGRPQEIVVELARPLKQSHEARRRAEKEQAGNQKKNDDRKALLRSVNAPVNGRNLMKLRLWEEQGSGVNRRCPYTGETIGLELLLSEKVDIDHILPFSRSLDDSAANKVVCLTAANREKSNKTPWEAFAGDEGRWSQILGCVEDLPPNKRWRFAENAMNRWDEEGGFLARQITDTQYLARLAREYLRHVCHPDRVRVSPGRLTALLRRRWGVDSILRDHNREGGDPPMDATFAKNRDDHRHHALDAAVIGCIDQGMVQKVAQAASRAEDTGLDRLMDDLDEPWKGFRDELAARVRGLTVSHKPEHGTGGRLHEDTAYGPTTEKEREKGFNLVYRKPLDGLTEKEIARIRDPDLCRAMQERVAFHRNGPDRLDVKQAVAKAAEDLAATAPWIGIRRARLLAKEADPIWLKGPDGEPYKGLIAGDVHHIDIVALSDGRWTGRAATLFEAHRTALPDGRAAPYVPAEGERFVMRLHKGDLVKLKHDGRLRIMRVARLEPANNRVRMAENFEAGELDKRHADPDDPFRWLIIAFSVLRQREARRVTVDPLGRVCDPGFPKWATTPAAPSDLEAAS